MSSSRKRRATEEPETEETQTQEQVTEEVQEEDSNKDDADIGHSYEVKGDGDEVDTQSGKITAKPSKEVIMALTKAYAARKWEGTLSEHNPNYGVAIAYKHRYLPHMGEVFLHIERPGLKPRGNNSNAKRYKADAVFTNLRFKIKPNEMTGEFVMPVSRAVPWGTSLQTGNFYKNARNVNKEAKWVSRTVVGAKKQIGLSGAAWKRPDGSCCRVTKEGWNADFMDAVASLQKMPRMVFEAAVNEDRSLMPKYALEAENKFFQDKANALMGTYTALFEREGRDYKEKKISKDEYRKRVATLRKEYTINKDGAVDMPLLREKTPSSAIVDYLMGSTIYKNKLKFDKDGVPYMVFDMDVARNTTDLEKKGWDEKKKCIIAEFAPNFPDDLCKAVYTGSKGTKTINHHTITDLADWGTKVAISKLNDELSDKDREKRGLAEWNRQVDALSLIGLKIVCKVFTYSGQSTMGVTFSFKDIIYYSPPTKDEISESKSQNNRGFQPKDEDKIKIYGAKPYEPTELTQELDVHDADEIYRNTVNAMVEVDDKNKSKRADEDEAMLAAAVEAERQGTTKA